MKGGKMDSNLLTKLRGFIEEDVGTGDVTSIIVDDRVVEAEIVCKEHAVIAGVEEAVALFNLVNCNAETMVRDGNVVEPDTVIMHIHGNARAVLAVERTVLNLLMRMSGIATCTRKYVEIVKSVNPNVKIASTRKTAPGLRLLDKKAVALGGGYMHRLGLYDMVLIKDNHLALVGSVAKAVRLAREMYGSRYRIEVEVRSLKEALEAIESGADMIMLDNLAVDDVAKIVDELKGRGLRDKVMIEVSGGINEDNIRSYARLDVDMISIGRITHSAKAIDMSLEIVM
ncbi:putative nicotinate-nucleotide pyrophosphorylase [carboxylating] [archaeon HR05]|jgi:nicotinate-nucleotide pyrophosphorylase (carboxylating)|uniref:Nicotinate-nucleotide pyrophosphorylase [carboxylating] n=2 Tax=Candidatus Nitrosocaldaceae TaxID=1968910 RepID=A0A2K5AQV3_9ARCH|nr:putative nicotinate-nucleotide pyrophosphorylase [carboxylating] [archaeon HR05]SPC34032.1 putative nicotinate-nucleotide pyrophosphorylase [carboxylating] [Candidatus Nitrosocaldus cavascurensis]